MPDEVQYHRLPAPKISRLMPADVTMLFEWHYYDGPMEGALEWEGKRYWFSAKWPEDDNGRLLELHVLDEDTWYWIDQIQASDRGCAMFPHTWRPPVALLELYPSEEN